MRSTLVIFLAGDSYPFDRPSEEMILGAISQLPNTVVHGQGSFINEATDAGLDWRNLALRLNQLGTLCRESDADDVILIGRSSGARVATLFAREHRIKAIICLSYPFENPETGPEGSRYVHLATLEPPTLIIQGTRDVYGGLEVRQKYTLSPNIHIHYIDAEHELRLTTEAWNEITSRITAIISPR